MGKAIRLDAFLVRNHLAPNKAHARTLITSGAVLVDGLEANKVARQIRPTQKVCLKKPDREWVGRGALKLLGALSDFNFKVTDLCCADLGASTGGFTQVLLKGGAQRVYAIDVGQGLLHWSIRTDKRVIVMEKTNARHLNALPEPIDLIVGDLSFISLQHILPAIQRTLRPGGHVIVLIKPQFEVHASQVASGGLVSTAAARSEAIERIKKVASLLNFRLLGASDCHLPGAKAKNVEHFIHLFLAPASSAKHSKVSSETTR